MRWAMINSVYFNNDTGQIIERFPKLHRVCSCKALLKLKEMAQQEKESKYLRGSRCPATALRDLFSTQNVLHPQIGKPKH